MSDRPRGDVLAGLLTGALLGVSVAMAISPVKAGSKRETGGLLARGQVVLDSAADGLEPLAARIPSISPGA